MCVVLGLECFFTLCSEREVKLVLIWHGEGLCEVDCNANIDIGYTEILPNDHTQ